MEQAKNASYQEVLERLLDCGPLKTWSLIVTILGDLAADDGARVAGPVITHLTEPMGMKPEALRVAIHRLRRDGWITSEREGRSSLYGLTAHGRDRTRAVFDRVYGTEVVVPATWHILIAQSADAMQALDFVDLIPISPKTALLAGEASDLPGSVLAWEARAGTVPEWVKEIIVPVELTEAYVVLAEALERAGSLDISRQGGDSAVLRLLALHQWRRLVLRHGAGVELLMEPDWAGARCRRRIGRLLDRFGRPDPKDLAARYAGASQA